MWLKQWCVWRSLCLGPFLCGCVAAKLPTALRGMVNFVHLINDENALDTNLWGVLGMHLIREEKLATSVNLYVSGAVLRVSGDVLFMVFDKNASKEYWFVHYATFEADEKVIKMLEVVSYDEHEAEWKRRKNPAFGARMWATVLQVNFISVCTASQLALLQPCTQRDAMDSNP